MTKGALLVLTGFSGAGKDTVMKELVEKHDWERVVSHAAGRDPRPGEIHGKDYYFVQEAEFLEMISNQEFIEYARPYGNWRGTTKKEIEKVHTGHKVIWRVDPWTAADIHQKIPEELHERVVTVFLTASEEFIKRRANERNSDGKTEVIMARLEDDLALWNNLVVSQKKFRYVVENREGRLGETVAEVIKIVETELQAQK